MSAPVATVRIAPTGIRLETGFPTKITFAANPGINIWEIEVKPSGADGGEPVDISTMFNTRLATMAPRVLIKSTPGSAKVAYDPGVEVDIEALINVRTTITWTFPDGSTWAKFGYLQKFEPDALKEGEMPTAQITIVPTNYDPVAHVEAGTTVVSVVGT